MGEGQREGREEWEGVSQSHSKICLECRFSFMNKTNWYKNKIKTLTIKEILVVIFCKKMAYI